MLKVYLGILAAVHRLGHKNVLDLPTGFWHELTTSLVCLKELSLPQTIRLASIGGERALPERMAAGAKRINLQACRLLNTYGPTESDHRLLRLRTIEN